MRIALILPGNIWYSPYVRIYTRILDAERVDYSIISWNRDGLDPLEGFQYGERHKEGSASYSSYHRYIRFVKKTILRERFDKLIVFGPQLSCLLNLFLVKYRNRFIIDYRDLSIEQRPVFKPLFGFLMRCSRYVVISSPGFKRVLPSRDYLLSHNFDSEIVKSILNQQTEESFRVSDGIKVLTIGGIRDYSSNIEVVKALANIDGYYCSFVGKGGASKQISDYCEEHHIKNVSFKGFYQKEEEAVFIKSCTFLNVFYPRKITHDTAMSNRFYNSLIYKRPMIVTKNTVQGDYVESYGLGIAIENCNDLINNLQSFVNSDFVQYSKRCDQLLEVFLRDDARFVGCIKQFVLVKD